MTLIQTIVGTKEPAGIYIPVETSVRLLLRCDPPDPSLVNAEWEPELREQVANALRGITVGAVSAEVVAVKAFAPSAAK